MHPEAITSSSGKVSSSIHPSKLWSFQKSSQITNIPTQWWMIMTLLREKLVYNEWLLNLLAVCKKTGWTYFKVSWFFFTRYWASLSKFQGGKHFKIQFCKRLQVFRFCKFVYVYVRIEIELREIRSRPTTPILRVAFCP